MSTTNTVTTLRVKNPNAKLEFYFGPATSIEKDGKKIDGWQPIVAIFTLPADWTPVHEVLEGHVVHARGPQGSWVETSDSGITNLMTPLPYPPPFMPRRTFRQSRRRPCF